MSKPATLSEICKALDPDNKRYSLDHYPPQVKKSPPVKVPPLIPEFVTLWAGISITWCLAEGFDWLAIFLTQHIPAYRADSFAINPWHCVRHTRHRRLATAGLSSGMAQRYAAAYSV